MDEHDAKTETPRDAESDDKLANVSRRTVLSSLGAGAATLGLGTGAAAASESGDSPATGFAEETSASTSATASGAWSNPSVWDSGIPGNGADVRIGPDASVTLGANPDADAEVVESGRIKTLVVEGDLSFATDVDTHLRAETIVTLPGSSLEIGTEDEPIQPDAEARITIVHHEDIREKDYDPERLSKGVITMGELEIHGAEKTSWDELATAPTAGETTIELASAPTNWTEGDKIVIPGLHPSSNEDDERTIASISGATVELDEPLEYDHVPPENNLDVELTAYALNRTRNVRFESAKKATDVTNETRVNRQGHLMIMKPAQSISYLEVDHFGRTNKNFWLDEQDYSGDRVHGHGTEEPSEPNIVARYGLHFHETGIDVEPHEVTGVVVQHSPGWGVVNHNSHANVRDSITYDVFGSGFVAEAGKERGSFERCFALRSEGSRNVKETYNDLNLRGRAPTEEVDFGHEGEGFWLQGPAVEVEDCVAAGHDGYAFALWNEPQDGPIPGELAKEEYGLVGNWDPVNPRFLPLKSFNNNTAFAASGGFDYGFSRPSVGESVVESFTVYNIGPRINTSTWHYPAGAPYFMGSYGNCCIANRYSSDLRVENPQFCNVDGESGHGPDGYHGHGIRRNYQAREPVGVYGGVMEGLNVGVQVCLNANEEDTDDVSFYNNRADVVFENRTVLRSLVDYDADHVADLTVHPGTKVDFWWSSADVKSQPEAAAWDGNSATHRVPGEYEFRWMDTPAMMTVTEDLPEGRGPIAAFGHQSTETASEPVTFDASPSTSTGSITSYEWSFGDGTTATGETVEHSYDTSGFYDVTLTVTDGAGDTGEITTEVAAGEAHEIRINGLDDQKSDYELAVSGELIKGADATVIDSIQESTVSAELGGGQDNYHYTGEITGWSLDKDIPIKVTIDGEEVDPSTLGQSGDPTPTPTATPDPEPDADKSVTVAPGGANAFSPAELQIHPGDTVAFEWESGGHTLTVDSQPDNASWAGVDTTQSGGATHTHTFDVQGTYEYYCSVHPDMQGTITVEAPTSGPVQSPYGRKTGWSLPGRVQAEDFDNGGSNVAYSDESSGNIGGEYRDTQVDIQALPDSEDNYNLGWMHEGDWVEYSVKVASEGTYDLAFRVASPQSGTVELGVTIGDTEVGPVTIPQTGGWNNYTTVTVSGVQLAAGEQVFRITMVNTGGHEYGCDLDWFEVAESDHESVPQAIDADDDGTIEDDEILSALAHWTSGEPVPDTGGQTVTDEIVLELVEMWKDETDITEGEE